MGLTVIAIVVALLALRRALGADRSIAALRAELAAMRARLAALEPALPAGGAAVPAAAPDAAGPVPLVAPPVPPVEVVAAPAGPATPSVLAPEAAAAGSPADGWDAGRVDEGRGMRPPPPDLGPAAAAPLPPAAGRETLEARIGSRWLLYLGVATLVLGLAYFVKYAFDNEWVAPPLRVALGLGAGLLLIGAGQRFVARGLAQYGQALTGGGIGTLYLALYAAHHWYGLIDRGPIFAAMAGVTLAGALLADRQGSQPLALLSIAVGFLVPFLVGGGGGSQVTLFTYDLILVCGAFYLARRRGWPLLVLVSYVLTLGTLYTWAGAYYRRRDYWITELYLTAFLILFLGMRRGAQRVEGAVASFTAVLLGLAPVLYHLASLAVLRPHRGALFVYLIGFSVAGTIAAGHLRMPWLRLLVWLGTAAPCLDIAAGRVAPGWVPGAWITIVAIFGVHLIAQIQALEEERPALPPPEVLLLHGHGLWMLACLWALVAPRDVLPALVAGLAAFYGVLALVARAWHREAALHAAALAAALAAVAFALEFSGPWLIVALAADGAAVVYLGLRADRGWLRAGGLALIGTATLLAANRLASPAAVNVWPLLNVRAAASLFVVATLWGAARLHRRAARSPIHDTTVAVLTVVGHLLVVAILSAEIVTYFAARAWQLGERPELGGSTWLAQQLALSLAWAAYAVALVAGGLHWRYRPVRYLAIGLLAVTAAKVFFVDLARLDRVYRMLSVIGLGLLLLLASYLYQRLRAQDAAAEPADPPSSHDPSIAP